MKVVILAGGHGTRLSEETETIPKPMVEIGGMPILWHIMKGYEAFGHKEFVIATGYKGHVIKSFFKDYATRQGSFVVHTRSGGIVHHEPAAEDWTVHVVDTGLDTQTGERLLALRSILKDDGPFMLTYGDGLSDVDLGLLAKAHADWQLAKRLVTLTAIRPNGRFGALDIAQSPDYLPGGKLAAVRGFQEKVDRGWVNGGFMVMSSEIFEHLPPATHPPRVQGHVSGSLEDTLAWLAFQGRLGAYLHDGYWQCMDTLREKKELDRRWKEGDAPWAARWRKP